MEQKAEQSRKRGDHTSGSSRLGTLTHDAARKKGLSNNEFAAAIGADPSTVSRIFSGKRLPSAELLTKIEHELGVTAEKVYRALWQ